MAKEQPKIKLKTIYKSAITGRIVSKEYADKNPNTTIKQIVRVNP